MQSQPHILKHRAPGSTLAQGRVSSPNLAQLHGVPEPQNTNDQQFADWTNSSGMENSTGSYPDASGFGNSDIFAQLYNAALNGNTPQQGNGSAQSNQMVRRNTNQQVAPLQQQPQNFLQPWQDMGDQLQPPSAGWDNSDEDENLEAKALAAKKDAQAKRKQIPPFVQKLSSFLDEDRNTDLIRWSDDGNSFIVVDEDEFAKTLIPELFKHNNYASFVRQLNMYGFHKKVGLTDNSMRASEQKKKLPSVYYNKYFKRGRPELLWLIQKPKSSSSSNKRKRDDKNKIEGDSDDDQGPQGMDLQGPRLADGGNAENRQLILNNSSEITRIRQELQQMQRQQKYILGVIQGLKRQNEQFYQQATAYQQLHDRHENSINAILTFLATFYNRSVDKGADINDIFSHAIPNKQQQQHGSVVDVGDGELPEMNQKSPNQLLRRRPLALLPAPNVTDQAMASPASVPSSARSAMPKPSSSPSQNLQIPINRGSTSTAPTERSFGGSASNSPLIKNDAETPNLLSQIPENDEMLSMIQAANANPAADSPSFDFPSALSQIQSANNNAPLTPQERDNMLALLANNGGTNGAPLIGNNNNALVSPNPPSIPPLTEIAAHRDQLDMLQKLQEEQNRKVSELADRLQPLSPNGTIPGLADDPYNFPMGQTAGNPDPFDINSYIQGDDYFNNPTDNGDLGAGGLHNTEDLFGDLGFNFGNDGTFDTTAGGARNNNDLLGNGVEGSHGRVESVSSGATSPAATVRGDDAEGEGSATKRRKVD